MPMPAYACRLTEENMGAIASEHPHFSRGVTLAWLEEHEKGYFIRDESSAFDCRYMTDEVFFQIYRFENFEPKALFHKIVKV